MKKDKNKTLLNLKKFNNAFKKELKAKTYSGGANDTPLSIMNTLIFEDRRSGAPKILFEGETLKKTEVIVEEKTIEQIKEDNIASQIEKINQYWNNGTKKEAKGWLGTTPSKPWTKETFIAHLNKNGVRTNNREIQNYIAEKFSISKRDFENKINQAKERKKEEDKKRRAYIAENSEEVNKEIMELFKKTQKKSKKKQEAERILKSTSEIGKELIKKRIKSLEEKEEKLKQNSSELIGKKDTLQKMQAEVTNTSILPYLNELFKAKGKSISEETFNRRIKGEQGNNTNMDSFYEELEERQKERKGDELALMDYDDIHESIVSLKPTRTSSKPISSMRAHSPILSSNLVKNSTINKEMSFKTDSEDDVKDQGGAVSGSSFVSDEGGGRKVGNTSSNEPISVSDDGGEKVSTLSIPSSEVKTLPRERKQTQFFAPSPPSKVTQASRSKLTQRSKKITKNRTSNKKASEPADLFADEDEDDARNWVDFNEESEEQEEKSSERKEPKFIEPEVEEAFEFSHTINPKNKTIIRNIIKNLNGILSNPILSLSTGSKSDIKHVNNVIIYDEIREGEQVYRGKYPESIYIPKYIPQLPSEQ